MGPGGGADANELKRGKGWDGVTDLVRPQPNFNLASVRNNVEGFGGGLVATVDRPTSSRLREHKIHIDLASILLQHGPGDSLRRVARTLILVRELAKNR